MLIMDLRDMYLRSNNLNEAEASYQESLELYQLSNCLTSHGIAFQSLGKIQLAKLNLPGAKALFEEALAVHQQAQNSSWQESDQLYLNEVLSKMGLLSLS
jgi:tetratricopeptide (TPR) repeat protein